MGIMKNELSGVNCGIETNIFAWLLFQNTGIIKSPTQTTVNLMYKSIYTIYIDPKIS